MPILYRVFPFLASAAPDEPGGAVYVPSQGGGRLDNPELYAVSYLSAAAPGAIAEAFGRFPQWSPAILAGSPGLPGSVRVIASYRLADDKPLCDLDDVEPSLEQPHGLNYSLTLHGPNAERILRFDNAHQVRKTAGPGGKKEHPADHKHRLGTARPYRFKNAAALIEDFWFEVDRYLKEKGVI